MTPVEALAIVAAVAGRYAMMARRGVRITFSIDEREAPFARVDFEDLDGATAPLEIDLTIGDREAFRGLVELAIFKHRNPGAT